MRRRHVLALAAAAAVAAADRDVLAQQEQGESLARIDDLGALLDAVRTTRRPLLLFFSTPGCPYCREVRRNYLAPRVADGEAASGVVIREVDITSRREFVDRGTQRTSEAALAQRFGVRMVPVIQLVGATAQPLGEPIVGLDRSGFFEARLQGAIDAARRTLAAR
jgi:thioredoxin-related protein